jgi:glucosamine-6-phosphate deaminase
MSGLAPLILRDERHVGALAAELIANRLAARPHARLLLEPGRTTDAMFAALRAHPPPASRASVLGLEELAGSTAIGARLRAQLVGVGFGALALIDGTAADLEAEAARHAARLEQAPVDLAVLGLGEDGEVAFDEPPARLASGVRSVALEGARLGLTVGLGSLYLARELLLLATGASRARALRRLLEVAPGPDSPASLLLDHPRITVIADQAAAALLTPRARHASDRALVVLGHREPGISSEHRISFESRARLRHARRLAERGPYRAVVLTGYTSTGGLSEAEQMKAAWDERAAPALLEVAGRDTAENATCSLPLLLAVGDLRHVVVVTSAWHLRTPWFFAPYRRFGLRVSYRVSFAHGHWPRMLRQELAGARRARTQRAAALARMRPAPL